MRHRRKKLTQRRILRNTLTVPAGMNHQHTKAVKRSFLFMKISQNLQRSPAGSDTPAITVRDGNKLRASRQEILPVRNLFTEAFCLLFIGSSQNHVVPTWEAAEF